MGCEIRLEDGDKRYAQLVDSLKKPGNHPLLRMKREASLVKAKADCKQFGDDLSVIKVVIGEKNLKSLTLLTRSCMLPRR